MAHGTHDCAPTLTDSQVLEFCKYGHLMLEGGVSEEINARCRRWLDDHHAGDGPAELQEMLRRSGSSSAWCATRREPGRCGRCWAPTTWSRTWTYFKGIGPAEANQWHIDGGSRFGPELDVLKWFYYPADSPVESGPTEFVPGSHHVYNQVRFMAHYGEIGGTWKAVAPAGSIYLTAYSLWHRRARATWDGVRYMVTSSAWRTHAPASGTGSAAPDVQHQGRRLHLHRAPVRGASSRRARQRPHVPLALRPGRGVSAGCRPLVAAVHAGQPRPLRRAGRPAFVKRALEPLAGILASAVLAAGLLLAGFVGVSALWGDDLPPRRVGVPGRHRPRLLGLARSGVRRLCPWLRTVAHRPRRSAVPHAASDRARLRRAFGRDREHRPHHPGERRRGQRHHHRRHPLRAAAVPLPPRQRAHGRPAAGSRWSCTWSTGAKTAPWP